ncbi:hypothetical protein AB0912_31340 [Streptomyces sp. NPDC007084]|uniref:hypothetical protein n=1 Tax=Streptomyces sp. NPDC007084 TaxID=3154313 RepID=UPI0034551B8B
MPSGLVVPDLADTDTGAAAADTVSVDADAVELVWPGNKTMHRKVKPLPDAEAAIPHLWRWSSSPHTA